MATPVHQTKKLTFCSSWQLHARITLISEGKLPLTFTGYTCAKPAKLDLVLVGLVASISAVNKKNQLLF